MKPSALVITSVLVLVLLAPSLAAHHRSGHSATPSPSPTSTTPTTPAPTTPTTPPTTHTTTSDHPTPTPTPTTVPASSPSTSSPAPRQTPTTRSDTPIVPPDVPDQPTEESPFGYVDIDAYPKVGSMPYRVNATVVLRPMHLSPLHRLLVSVPDHSPHLIVELGGPRRLDGTPIPILEDGREDGEERWILDADAVTDAGGTFVVPLVLQTTSNGRFHFGVYVAGFDKDWEKFTVALGFTAETYGRSAVSGVGHPRGFFDPPFRGDGNAIPTPSAAIFLVAMAAAVGVLRRRRPPDLVHEDVA